MKKISIITVCFNSEKTIEQTIKSILNQSYGMENIEYIIIDGKSTDRTVEIVNKYRDKIAYFVSEQDNGIYDAMNKGISAATGEIIGLLNSDDWYEPKALEYVTRCFEEQDTDIVYGEVKMVGEDGTIYDVKKVDPLTCAWFMMPIWHPAMFVKKTVYQENGMFDTKFKISADYEYVLRCYSNGVKFRYLDENLTYFRFTGVSNVKHLKAAKETNEITLRYIDKAPDRCKVLEENDYRIKAAIFKEKCISNPKMLMETVPQIRKEKLVIWGTGILGKMIVKMLIGLEMKIDYLVDSDSKKEGEIFCGIEIKKIQELRGSNAFVVIAIRRKNADIENALSNLGIEKEKYIFLEDWMTAVAKEGMC